MDCPESDCSEENIKEYDIEYCTEDTTHNVNEACSLIDCYCEKNPGHFHFFSPGEIKKIFPNLNNSLFNHVIDRTVRLQVCYVSPARPDSDVLSANKGKSSIHYGTGFVTEIAPEEILDDIRSCDGSKYFLLVTASHVIFDDSEAQQTHIDFFYDDVSGRSIRKGQGIKVIDSCTGGDYCVVLCVTRDKALYNRFENKGQCIKGIKSNTGKKVVQIQTLRNRFANLFEVPRLEIKQNIFSSQITCVWQKLRDKIFIENLKYMLFPSCLPKRVNVKILLNVLQSNNLRICEIFATVKINKALNTKSLWHRIFASNIYMGDNLSELLFCTAEYDRNPDFLFYIVNKEIIKNLSSKLLSSVSFYDFYYIIMRIATIMGMIPRDHLFAKQKYIRILDYLDINRVDGQVKYFSFSYFTKWLSLVGSEIENVEYFLSIIISLKLLQMNSFDIGGLLQCFVPENHSCKQILFVLSSQFQIHLSSLSDIEELKMFDRKLSFEEFVKAYTNILQIIKEQYKEIFQRYVPAITQSNGLVFHVSHPHGKEKRISLGEIKDMRTFNGFYELRYDVPTCKGSSGGPVCVIFGEDVPIVVPHSGYRENIKLNTSSSFTTFLQDDDSEKH